MRTVVRLVIVALVFAGAFALNTGGEHQNFSLPHTGHYQTGLGDVPEAKVNQNKVKSIFVPGKFYLNVVSYSNNAPDQYGVGQGNITARNIFLLAHNTLSGSAFYVLAIGDEIILTFEGGTKQTFEVKDIRAYQATNPHNYGEPFISAGGAGKELKPSQIRNQVYRPNHLTLQTCIWGEGISTWGVLFVIAKTVK